MITEPQPTPATMSPETSHAPAFEINFSRGFESWLRDAGVSIGCTTYQAGKVFLFGSGAQGVSIVERTFARCMGLAAGIDRFYLASLYQLWRFNNMLGPGEDYQGYDRLFVPQVGWTTGDVDVHDIGIDRDGQPVFVNTLFSCLARPSQQASFEVLWKPPFISKLAAEDRCHLNGLAMVEGAAVYVTLISQADAAEGWREHRANGGLVMNIRSNEIVCSGLSMPHSPRWYRGKLWLLNSGNGELGTVDLASGRFDPVCVVPGYARGLAFVGEYALVGLSRARNRSFSGLGLDQQLAQRKVEARCGIAVIDLRTGDQVHSVRFEGVVEELYDVAVIPAARRPMLLGFKSDEIKRMIRPE